MRRSWLVISAVLAVAFAAPERAAAQVLYAIETTYNDPTGKYASYLVSFNVNNPGALLSTVKITGADVGTPASGNPNGEQFIISGIDYVPFVGFAMGYRGGVNQRFYGLDFQTGVVTARPSGPSITTESAAFADIPPGITIRTTSESGGNFKIDPSTGATTAATSFAYVAGDANAGQTPIIKSESYTEHAEIDPFDPVPYVIDARGPGWLAQVGPAFQSNRDDTGELHTVGALGVLIPAGAHVGFYIPPGNRFNGHGYAAIEINGVVNGLDTPSELFSIDLTTGAATNLGQIGLVPGAGSLTVWGLSQVPEPGSLALVGAAAVVVLRFGRRRKAGD
jgi:hypothetical protein